jgi:lysyl-tRNA synthetase class 2
MKDDFLPTASIETLRARAELIRTVRQFFDERNFFEVDTPLLSHDIVVDRYLHPVCVPKNMVTGVECHADEQLWLQTSPEFGMKRLVVAGAQSIYQIGKCFRQSETGRMHNPEFTMLEWYRVGDDMKRGMELLSELVSKVLSKPKARFLSYRDAFVEFANVDPFDSSVGELKSAAIAANVTFDLSSEDQNRDDWLNLILSRVVEPKLGVEQPTIVFDWPASQAALAIVRDADSPVAERFELYVDGVELANGYHELLDADELSKRNSINNQQRVKDGSPILPEDSRLLAAMRQGMPQCAGVALGIDRLVMLAVGAQSIEEVLAFPIDRA